MGLAIDIFQFQAFLKLMTKITKLESWDTEEKFEKERVRKQFVFVWLNMYCWFWFIAFVAVPYVFLSLSLSLSSFKPTSNTYKKKSTDTERLFRHTWLILDSGSYYLLTDGKIELFR